MAALFGTNICDGSENFLSQWFNNNNNTDFAGVAGPIYYVVTPNSLLAEMCCAVAISALPNQNQPQLATILVEDAREFKVKVILIS